MPHSSKNFKVDRKINVQPEATGPALFYSVVYMSFSSRTKNTSEKEIESKREN